MTALSSTISVNLLFFITSLQIVHLSLWKQTPHLTNATHSLVNILTVVIRPMRQLALVLWQRLIPGLSLVDVFQKMLCCWNLCLAWPPLPAPCPQLIKLKSACSVFGWRPHSNSLLACSLAIHWQRSDEKHNVLWLLTAVILTDPKEEGTSIWQPESEHEIKWFN